MKSTGIRRTFAALVALVLLSIAANPAPAADRMTERSSAPVIFDAMIMRPLGFLTLGLGTGLFVITLPILAVTHPQDVGLPWNILVVRPAKFIWADPLGQH